MPTNNKNLPLGVHKEAVCLTALPNKL